MADEQQPYSPAQIAAGEEAEALLKTCRDETAKVFDCAKWNEEIEKIRDWYGLDAIEEDSELEMATLLVPISKYTDFVEWQFNEHVDFSLIAFSGNANFNSATFSGDASFRSVTFSGDAWFGEAKFSGDASFRSVTFSGSAYFRSVTFSGSADFHSATFSKDVKFIGGSFEKKVTFQLATFEKVVHFEQRKFKGDASFVSTSFKGSTYFCTKDKTEPCKFYGEADFKDASFAGIPFFSEKSLMKPKGKNKPNILQTHLTILNILVDREDKARDFDKAEAWYILEATTKRRMEWAIALQRAKQFNVFKMVGAGIMWLGYWLYKVSSNYGTSVGQSLGVLLGLVFGIPLLLTIKNITDCTYDPKPLVIMFKFLFLDKAAVTDIVEYGVSHLCAYVIQLLLLGQSVLLLFAVRRKFRRVGSV